MSMVFKRMFTFKFSTQIYLHAERQAKNNVHIHENKTLKDSNDF